jgi:hypothetical protein
MVGALVQSDNTIKALCALAEEDSHDYLIALLLRKYRAVKQLWRFALLRPFGVTPRASHVRWGTAVESANKTLLAAGRQEVRQ